MQPLIYIGLAFFMGIVLAVYLPMNGSVARHLGSAVSANLTFFVVAFLTAIVTFALFGSLETLSQIGDVPPYLFLTGLIGSLIVLGATTLVPELGARRFFILLVSGQIVMAVVVSHYGWLSSPQDPITVRKVFGAVLVFSGAIITTG